MARTKVTFASCNLYNLNEPGIRMYRDADGWSQAEYDKKIAWTSNALKNGAADVWAFQELWHQRSLRKAFQTAGLSGQYKLLIPPNHLGRKIVCAGAVKSSILVGQPEWISDFPDNFKLHSKGDDPQTPDIAVEIDGFSR
ncbi:MAG: hypothetical protein ABW079_17800, partial [Sedimenticola sp.]